MLLYVLLCVIDLAPPPSLHEPTAVPSAGRQADAVAEVGIHAIMVYAAVALGGRQSGRVAGIDRY